MGTIVGLESAGGTVLAGDRLVTQETVVKSRNERKVFDFESAGVAATGEPGGVDEFAGTLESEIRRYQTEQERTMRIDPLANVAADVAEATEVDAIVSTFDPDSVARIRQVGRDGSILADETVALGSGAAVALGRLDDADLDVDIETATSLAREVLATVAERDAGTGTDVDVWRLENAD